MGKGPEMCTINTQELLKVNQKITDDEAAVLFCAAICARKNTNAIIMPDSGFFDISYFRHVFWERNEEVNIEHIIDSLIKKRILLEEPGSNVSLQRRNIYLNPYLGFNGNFNKVLNHLLEKFSNIPLPLTGDVA